MYITSGEKNREISQVEITKISKNLRKKGIPTEVKELIDNLDYLISESRNQNKFLNDINKK